ncbi:DUF6807 family protein [Caulobacter sp. NIBR2454]|uniref:DUF6807 family protein n=1 Tax=Caulobacter sp. NIBR2454 TaxID=3015996 RepID=UPI0022B6CDB1|nr:DUF6807 family protein [Caulobacter sp. NIBR2454]
MRLLASLAFAAAVTTAAPAFAQIAASMADDGVTITDAGKPVLFYRTKAADPADPGRLNFVHPLYAPDGTVLTEEKPVDHIHHRGVFWSWHQVLASGASVGDGWFMQGLGFRTTERAFADGALTVKVDWLDAKGATIAHEVTKVTPRPLAAEGARRIDFDTTIMPTVDGFALGGSDDVKGYGGFSIRTVRPDALSFVSDGKPVTPRNEAVEAGGVMALEWPREAGYPAWTIHVGCKAQDKPVTSWILRKSLSMQNCVFPGRAPFPIAKGQALRLESVLVVSPAKGL